MWYAIPVYLPDGETDTVYISEEFYTEEKLYIGTNLEKYIHEFYGLVNVGYPRLVEEREIV